MTEEKNKVLQKQLIDADMQIETLTQDIDCLRQALNRFSLLSNNISPSVDVELVELRRQLKNKSPCSNLMIYVNRISQAMLALEQNQPDSPYYHLINQLIDELISLNIFNIQEKNKFERLMAKHVDETYLITRFIETFKNNLSLYASKSIQVKNIEEKEVKINQNVLASGSQFSSSRHCNDDFNDTLQELLAIIYVPNNLKYLKKEIANQLNKRIAFEQVESLIENISLLIIQSYREEQNKFKVFLESLNARFLDVDQYFKNVISENNALSTDSYQLKQSVNKSIDLMKSHYKKITDLSQLIAVFDNEFDNIINQLQFFYESEKKKQTSTENKIKQLQKKLNHTQQKALDLQASLLSVSEQSQIDSLTGLFNRDAYETKLDHYLSKVKLLQHIFIMAVVDIDHFKSINDNFGHLTGDDVLKQAAKLIKDMLRESDFIARYGGEEFVLIFEQKSIIDAEKLLDRIRQKVERTILKIKGKEIQLTISVGFTLIDQQDTKESAFSRADKALYQAKANGRNQIVYKTWTR